MDYKKLGIVYILLILLPCDIKSQFDSNNSTNFNPESLQQIEDEELDSISVKYFYLPNISRIIDFSDTSINNLSHVYDPSRLGNIEYFNLGNTGSASYPILSSKRIVLGTNYGYNSYDIYRLSNTGFRFYDVNRPFFDFTFTPVGGQKNFVINTDFARNFSDGMSLSINYNRINQEGFYQSQSILHTNFGMGVWYHHPNNKRDIFFTFKNEINTEDHNGGVASRDAFSDSFSEERMSIPVNISTAATRFQHRSYEFSHIYRFQDSTSAETGYELVSDLSLNKGYYKYSDESVNQDQEYYGDFYIDSRGIRNYLGYTQLNTSQIFQGPLFKGLSGQIGFDYTHHSINQDVKSISKNDIFLRGNLNIPLSSSFDILASTKLGLASATGEFVINGKAIINLPKEIILESDLTFYRNQHPLIANSLFVNGINKWENDLSKPFGTIAKAKVQFPFLDMSVGLSQSAENNALYWNESTTPVLTSGVYTASTLDIQFRFKLWKFNFYQFFAGQIFNDNIYNLPKYYAKNQIYWQSVLFKGNLDLKLGLEGRLIGSHRPINFNPLLSVFYSSETQAQKEPIYPFVDAFLVANIEQFIFFLRYENVGSYLDDRIYYQIGNYPQFDKKLRLGIKWKLHD